MKSKWRERERVNNDPKGNCLINFPNEQMIRLSSNCNLFDCLLAFAFSSRSNSDIAQSNIGSKKKKVIFYFNFHLEFNLIQCFFFHSCDSFGSICDNNNWNNNEEKPKENLEILHQKKKKKEQGTRRKDSL